MNKKENQGYLKTHQNIKNYLLTAIENKPMKNITVNEICQGVQINRSTFYAHFKDIYDVLEDIGNDLNEVLTDRYSHVDINDYQAMTVTMLYHIKDYRKFYLILLHDYDNPVMRSYLTLLQKQIAQPIYDLLHIDDRSANYYFNFTISGTFTMIRMWLDDRCPESPEQMAKLLLSLQPVSPQFFKEIISPEK